MVWKLFLWSSLRKSYSICRENSDMAEFWPFKTKIWPFFWQNWQFWEFFTYNFKTPPWIFLIFGMEVVLMVFFEEIVLYMPGNSGLAKFWPSLNFPSIQSMIFSKKAIKQLPYPKLGRFMTAFGVYKAKNPYCQSW